MEIAIEAKFDQNESLAKYLVDTGSAKLCEANTNKYWGIGVMLKSKDLGNRSKWQEENQLGKLLIAKKKKLKQK